MWIVCGSDSLRKDLISSLSVNGATPPEDTLLTNFGVLPKQGNVVVAVEDLSDANLRHAIRHFLVNADGWPKLAVVRRQWDDVTTDRLAEAVRAEYRRADQLNQAAVHRAGRLPESEWRSEQLEQLAAWRTIPSIQYSSFVLGPELRNQLEAFFPSFLPFDIKEDTSNVKTKPPVLHWTAQPLDGETQVILRVSFLIAGPDENTFRELCRSLRSQSDHSYEWTGGVLLTSDPVRVHVERVSDRVIEIAGRINEDEVEGAAAARPMGVLWPYLGAALRATLNAVKHQQHMVYSLDIVPFSECLFRPPLDSRVFDLAEFMTTVRAFGRVAARINGVVHDVLIHKLLPDGAFHSLAELTALDPPSTRTSRSDSGADSSLDVLPPLEAPSPSGLTVNHNRGRRVSFGSIKLMSESAAPMIGGDAVVNGHGNGDTKGVDAYLDGIVNQSLDLRTLYVD